MRDTAANIDTIKANVGFDKLQAMREASPTGGALGQVSDFENRLLQAVLSNLDQAQSEQQFLDNLEIVEGVYADIVHGKGFWERGEDGAIRLTVAPADYTPGTQYRFKGGDPSDPNNYEVIE